jgi:hypothetical protein
MPDAELTDREVHARLSCNVKGGLTWTPMYPYIVGIAVRLLPAHRANDWTFHRMKAAVLTSPLASSIDIMYFQNDL